MGGRLLNISIILASLSLRNIFSAFLVFFCFLNFFLESFYGQSKPFVDQSETIINLNLQLLFSILSLILSRILCQLRRKLCNAKIYPLEVQILQKKCLTSFYGQFMQLFHISEHTLSKQFLN